MRQRLAAALAAFLTACGTGGDPARGHDSAGSTPATSEDSSGGHAPTVRMVEVNRGASGMAARVRWAMPDDRSAILVMEDPSGVENEPFPNGFVLARETRDGVEAVQQDSVWDAAPAPDWSAAAFGRAHRVSAGERDSLTTAQWDSLARAAGLPVSDARRGAGRRAGG